MGVQGHFDCELVPSVLGHEEPASIVFMALIASIVTLRLSVSSLAGTSSRQYPSNGEIEYPN